MCSVTACITLTGNTASPSHALRPIVSIDLSSSGYEVVIDSENKENENTTFKQSYYAHDYKGKENEFIKNKYYDLLFKDEVGTSELEKVYWLAGRYVILNSDVCAFGVYRVGADKSKIDENSSCLVHGRNLYNSHR